MDPALLSRLQMLGAGDGGGGGGAGGAIMMAGYSPPIFGSLEQYHQKIFAGLNEYMNLMNKQVMPGIGQFSSLPTMNPNSLLARIIGEIFADIFQSVQDAGIDTFASAMLSEEDKQKLMSVMEAIGRLEVQDSPIQMQMVGGGWKTTLEGRDGDGGMAV